MCVWGGGGMCVREGDQTCSSMWMYISKCIHVQAELSVSLCVCVWQYVVNACLDVCIYVSKFLDVCRCRGMNESVCVGVYKFACEYQYGNCLRV